MSICDIKMSFKSLIQIYKTSFMRFRCTCNLISKQEKLDKLYKQHYINSTILIFSTLKEKNHLYKNKLSSVWYIIYLTKRDTEQVIDCFVGFLEHSSDSFIHRRMHRIVHICVLPRKNLLNKGNGFRWHEDVIYLSWEKVIFFVGCAARWQIIVSPIYFCVNRDGCMGGCVWQITDCVLLSNTYLVEDVL